MPGQGHDLAFESCDEVEGVPGCSGAAVFSADRKYRYLLVRIWGEGPIMVFGMLNPSKAGARQDDNTIRRCRGFATRERCGGLVVVNLYGIIETDPKLLVDVGGLVGEHNDTFVIAALGLAGDGAPLVVAWGANVDRGNAEEAKFTRKCAGLRLSPLCLGTNKDGTPRHPLYLAKTTPLVPYKEIPA